MAAASDEIKLSNHPSYDLEISDWNDWATLFEGTKSEVLAKFLVLHLLERNAEKVEGAADLLDLRKKLTEYTNFPKQIFKRYQSLVFKTPPTYSDEAKAVFKESGFLDDVDGQGRSLAQFVKEELFQELFLFAKPMLLTDSPGFSGKTLAEQQAAKLRPYWSMLGAREVHDWITNADGSFKMIRTEYDRLADREDELSPIKIERLSKVYLQKTDGKSKKYIQRKYKQEESGVKSESGAPVKVWKSTGAELEISKFEEIPVSAMPQGDSWLQEVGPHCRTYLNLWSSLMCGLHNQAWQRILVFGDPPDEARKAVNQYVLSYLPGATGVNVIQPAQTTSLEALLDRTEMLIFRLAFHFTRLVASDSKAVEAADTIARSKEDLLALLVTAIEGIENMVNRSAVHASQFIGAKSLDPNKKHIVFNKQITMEDLDLEIQRFQAFWSDICEFRKWKGEALKKILSRMNLNDAKEIEEEIDNRPEESPDKLTAGQEALKGMLEPKPEDKDPEAK